MAGAPTFGTPDGAPPMRVPPTGATGGGPTDGAVGFPSGSPSAAIDGRGQRAGRGGMFGGDQSSVAAAIEHAQANGGGTIVVSGQMGAASSILSSGARVAGIGGFSGRESEVSVRWFADRVAAGAIRWVVTSSGGLRDSRTGANTVMDAVAASCAAVDEVSGLYDCQGSAAALSAAAA